MQQWLIEHVLNWNLLSAFIGSVPVSGLVIWFVKLRLNSWDKRSHTLFEDVLKKQRDEFKLKLDQQKAIFDQALSKQAFEHQTVYPRLH